MKNEKQQNMKVLVCQRGARHRFAVPRLLHEAGMLSALYTDSCRYSRLGKIADGLSCMGVKPRALAALAARNPIGIPARRAYCSDILSLPRFLGGKESLAPAYRKWGLGQADVIYSMYGEDPDFLEWAKGQGARIIVDVFVHPATNRIVAEEEKRVIGSADFSDVEREDAHSRRVFKLADLLLCPSEWVADGVREFMPECRSRIRVVPYGSSVKPGTVSSSRSRGTILFAGREPLRKGLHHLAAAAHLLRSQGLEIDVRVAGVSSAAIEWMEHRSELNCLGSIPLSQMKKEYARADVFVLPSLSEGQAGVLIEAMACGVPVVATRESGVDFKPGCGVAVPVGNPSVLAKEIKTILEDEGRWRTLAEGALRQSELFSMMAWRKRLVDVVEELAQ